MFNIILQPGYWNATHLVFGKEAEIGATNRTWHITGRLQFWYWNVVCEMNMIPSCNGMVSFYGTDVIIWYVTFLTEILFSLYSLVLVIYECYECLWDWDFVDRILFRWCNKLLSLSNIHCFNWNLFSVKTRQNFFPILGSSHRFGFWNMWEHF